MNVQGTHNTNMLGRRCMKPKGFMNEGIEVRQTIGELVESGFDSNGQQLLPQRHLYGRIPRQFQ